MKNFIIGYGETLTNTVEIKGGSGPKKHPYSLQEGRRRFERGLSDIIDVITDKPSFECANDEVVLKFTQHPTYLAKSYYPKSLFKRLGVVDVGSKPVHVRPEKWATKDHPEEGLSSCIYISGTKSNYVDMLEAVRAGELEETHLKLLRTMESISLFESSEKIKQIDKSVQQLKLEVVIHAAKSDTSILRSFQEYLTSIGGVVESKKIKSVGGLTFLPVEIARGNEEKLANFSHLRVLRSVPKLRFNKPDVTRTTVKNNVFLPETQALNKKIKVCIFDGGIGEQHLIGQWAREIVPNDISSSHPSLLSHGGEVCSTYLFGQYDSTSGKLGAPYTDVDVVRVLSPGDNDPDLFDVLDRIENVLKEKKYKFINLSLGPRIAVDDDEVHVWTSVLDSYLQDGSCLATVAIGNDGDLEGEYARIQPPSDMVNSLSIGACDSVSKNWKRASYSCIGPGRSPGIVKPDGLMFGGSEANLFQVYSPLTHSIVGTMGTSYASPLALRVAAGIDAITDFDLTPTTIKALMVHNVESSSLHQHEVGWGRFPTIPEKIIECSEDEATIMFQGVLKPSEHVRIPIPLPANIDCTWVHLKATFCINTVTDPEHPLHYTRGGLDITFRPKITKVKEEANHAETKTFFSCKKLYPNEQQLREDAHKWETCLSQKARFKRTTLETPIFDVKYHAREQGGSPLNAVEPISYSLILTIRAQGNEELYNSILQENRTLQAIKASNRIRI